MKGRLTFRPRLTRLERSTSHVVKTFQPASSSSFSLASRGPDSVDTLPFPFAACLSLSFPSSLIVRRAKSWTLILLSRSPDQESIASSSGKTIEASSSSTSGARIEGKMKSD